MTIKKDDITPRDAFKSFLAKKGMRVTKQRMVICAVAYKSNDHFTAETLLEIARAKDPAVSRPTVYRCLPVLIESGVIREVDVGRDCKYYVSTRNQNTFQAQLVCLDCDKITEIDAPFMEWYGKTVAGKHNMQLASQRLQVTTHCENKNCPKRNKKMTPLKKG